MTRKLIFYWYVPSEGWNPLYDLHIQNLNYYKDRFDETELIVSTDWDTKKEHIDNTVSKLQNIFPNIVVTPYTNDKKLREAKYFREEIATKLDTFPEDMAVFFAHNKGVSSNYVRRSVLFDWINFMYFANLYDIDEIKRELEDHNICSIGTFTVENAHVFSFLKYNWHYSGTFYWIVPSRIYKRIVEYHEQIPYPDRYFAEGFLGTVLPYDHKINVHRYGTVTSCMKCSDKIRNLNYEDNKKYHEITDKFKLKGCVNNILDYSSGE